MIKIEQYFDQAQWQKFTKASEGRQTPFLVVDLSRIKTKFEEMVELFPKAKIHYAMKASPAVEVIELLAGVGSNCDCASIYELDRVLSVGVEPERISYGNTIKKASHVKYAYDKGIRLYATDSKPTYKILLNKPPVQKSLSVSWFKVQKPLNGHCLVNLAVTLIWQLTFWYKLNNWV